MSDRNNLKSARAYRSPKGGWELEVIFNDGTKGKLGAVYDALDYIDVEIKNSNLKEFTVEV